MSFRHGAQSRGSQWRRWDPHIHAPGTLAEDNFQDRWEDFCTAVETRQPPVHVLGVTDYMCFETYRRVKERRNAGRLQNVALLFPNVEMRLDVKTEKGAGINVHLLFSPDDADHESQIERVLAQLSFRYRDSTYTCSLADLRRLGRDFHGNRNLGEREALRVGANLFKVPFDAIRKLFDEKWVRRNCLVAVAGGSKDGTATLQKDGSFAALRQEIESFAHIIFSANPSQRDFWLGESKGWTPEKLRQIYGSPKPCLHGSDAHAVEAVLLPAQDRFCWLKGDPTFETLRQAVLEPKERVWIGPSAPSGAQQSYCIDAVSVSDAPWLHDPEVPLNSGIVAIIGARGSGKTALADMVAVAGGASRDALGPSSFLYRASHGRDLLGAAAARIHWMDGSESDSRELSLRRASETTTTEVTYLSQNFVETLCAASGLAIQLKQEIERVIFESTPQTDRLGTSSFTEMADVILGPIRRDRIEALEALQEISNRITHDELLREQLGTLRERHRKLGENGVRQRAELATLVPKGQEERARKLTEARLWVSGAETRVERLGRRVQALQDLNTRVNHIRSVREPKNVALLKTEFESAGLQDTEWQAFRLDFVGDVTKILATALREAESRRSVAITGDPNVQLDPAQPRADWPLTALAAYRDRLQAEVGSDVQQQRKYADLERAIRDGEKTLEQLTTQILQVEAAPERIRVARTERRKMNSAAFETIRREEDALRKLYAPLTAALTGASRSLAKLRFDVSRSVNLKAWCDAGENLFDLRVSGAVRGRGKIMELAEQHLLATWLSGEADAVADAMESFITAFWHDMSQAHPRMQREDVPRWRQDIANWLFDVSHISVAYTLTYDGVAIEQLSPGTRGIVLLLLYLAIDTTDRRPLIVDQPEENLDPRSVFEELVPHFREARKRRQIIIVTHNANLVVNTDVDQVIFAASEYRDDDALPTICYVSGPIEDAEIRKLVCFTLEGGEDAFRERERRYRLDRD